ncbi:MAG: hypothetical protein IKU25_03885 [Clostridia bacterium]|nr:hypothetical protein [Clostridia bacterium]
MKKVFCGIIYIVLIVSVFAACGATEKSTTTTMQLTTEPATTVSLDNSRYVWTDAKKVLYDEEGNKVYPDYSEDNVRWLKFSKNDYASSEYDAVMTWLSDDIESLKSAMGEDYYDPTIFIAKYDMDNDGIEDLIVYICDHIGFSGSAGSALSVMYYDGKKIINEEYIAHFRLDTNGLESEYDKQIGVYSIEKDNDISVQGKIWSRHFIYQP